MVARNVQVPMYQARLPMRSGGGMRGRIDLTERPEPNPIVQALMQMVQQKRQQEQDVLGRQMTEARIGQMGQPKQPTMKIQVGADGNTYTVNTATGETTPILKPDGTPLKAPKSKVGDRSTIDIINDMGKVSRAAGAIPTDALEQPIIDAQMGPLRQELMGGLGLEEVEVPGEKRERFGIDWLARDIPPRKEIRKRKRVESKAVKKPTPITEALTATHPRTGEEIKIPPAAKEERRLVRKVKAKERPPKPKEYPNAVWNAEHGMWTIVKNGRLMGIQ